MNHQEEFCVPEDCGDDEGVGKEPMQYCFGIREGMIQEAGGVVEIWTVHISSNSIEDGIKQM